MGRIAIIGLAIFTLGVLLGYWAGSRVGGGKEHDPGMTQPMVGRDRTMRAGESGRTSEASSARKPAIDAARPPAEALPDASADLLAKAIESIPEPDPKPAGTGRITGVVHTESGAPVAGVLIQAEQRPPMLPKDRPFTHPPWDPRPEKPIVERVLDFVRDHRLKAAARREAWSDANGTFVLEGLPEEEYSLTAHLEGYRVKPTGGAWSVKPGDRVQFVVKRVVAVHVSVLLPDGTPPPEAHLRREDLPRRRDSVTRMSTWRPIDATLWLYPGGYRLKAMRGDELNSDPQNLIIEDNAKDVSVTLQLKGRPGVRGRVIVPPGEEIDEIVVYLLAAQEGGTPDLKRLQESGVVKWARRQRDFQYSFWDLPTGTYLIGASRSRSSEICAVDTVEVLDSVVIRDVTLPAMDRAGYLVVRLFGPTGEPVEEAQFKIGYRSENGSSSKWVPGSRQTDGSFCVIYPTFDGESLGDDVRHFIRVYTQAYGTRTVQYVRSETSEVRIDFAEPAALEVVFEGYEGSGYERSLEVEVRDSAGVVSRWNSREQRTFSGGCAVLRPVPPGSYDLTVKVMLDPFRRLPVETVAVTLVAGTNKMSLRLPPLYSLTVAFGEDRRAGKVYLMPRGGSMDFSSPGRQVGGDGKIVFEKVPAGEYKVVFRGERGLEEMAVTVPSPSEILFRADPRTP